MHHAGFAGEDDHHRHKSMIGSPNRATRATIRSKVSGLAAATIRKETEFMSEFVLWGFDASTYVRTIKMLLAEKTFHTVQAGASERSPGRA
jgi:hypothetical protein